MRNVTALFILLLPLTILFLDWLVFEYYGYAYTITGVVRSWSKGSPWPEFAFVVGSVILYLHLFRGWPNVPGSAP